MLVVAADAAVYCMYLMHSVNAFHSAVSLLAPAHLPVLVWCLFERVCTRSRDRILRLLLLSTFWRFVKISRGLGCHVTDSDLIGVFVSAAVCEQSESLLSAVFELHADSGHRDWQYL